MWQEAGIECASREAKKIIIDDPGSAVFGWLEMPGVESSLRSSVRPRPRGERGSAFVPRFGCSLPKLLPFVQPMTLRYFLSFPRPQPSMTVSAYDNETS